MKFHYQALLFTLCVVMTACGAPAATSTAETAPSATPAPEWQTYTNADAGFSIRYPPTWKAEALPDVNNGALHALSITGPEGGAELHWGVGLGGACPDGWQTIKVAQGELQTCYLKNDDGTERWDNINKELPTAGFSAMAYTSDTSASSHDLVLKIISTLSFPERGRSLAGRELRTSSQIVSIISCQSRSQMP
jgi:hypothetical protein